MKESRFSEEQIIGILREAEAGLKAARKCAAATALRKRRCTSGRRSTAVWKWPTPSGLGASRMRTGG